jgi:NAD(P)-dependent dehydrogenase (short-subunit alcohol dehydrogenase family)
MSANLTAKVVAVTGGFGALGAAVAKTLAEAGATVAILDHAPAPATASSPASSTATAPASAIAGGHPAGALLFGGIDLAQADAANSVMQRIVAAAGRLDGLVNVAGGFRYDKLDGGSLETWDYLYRMNLRTAVVTCQAALPFLVNSGAGRIVNIGALGATKAVAGMGPYAASKAGVARLTESLADELKDRGVTVNAVLPSTIDTPRNRLDMPDADFSRWVSPSAIADVIAFLLSDAASAVTGALIPVAGRA